MEVLKVYIVRIQHSLRICEGLGSLGARSNKKNYDTVLSLQ